MYTVRFQIFEKTLCPETSVLNFCPEIGQLLWGCAVCATRQLSVATYASYPRYSGTEGLTVGV